MKSARKLGALAVVAMLLLSVLAPAALAAAAWDTETTNTATTSDVDSTTTSVTYEPGNASQSTWFEIDADPASNYTLRLEDPDTGYVFYENSTADETDATNGFYGWNVTHDELGDAPRDVDGNDYEVVVYNESSQSVDLNETVTFDASAQSGTTAVMHVADESEDTATAALSPLVADRLTLETKSAGILGSLLGSNDTTVATWSGYTEINGSSSDVEVHLANTSTADAYSSVAGGYEDGDWIRESTIWLNGVPHKVYKGSAPDDAEGTTVVYNSGTDTLEITPSGEGMQDVRQLQMRGGAGEAYGFGTLSTNFGLIDALASLLPF